MHIMIIIIVTTTTTTTTTCGHKTKDITPLIAAWTGERGVDEKGDITDQPDENHWSYFKGNDGETSERRGGEHNYGLF